MPGRETRTLRFKETKRVREDEPEEVTGFQSLATTYWVAGSASLSSREPLDSLQQ